MIVSNHKILFISSLYYVLLIAFDIASIVLWFLTFAVTSGFVLFPAESEDLYGTFIGLFTNPVYLFNSFKS